MPRLLFGLVALAVAGCGGSESLMPLRVGEKRNYIVRFPFYGTVEAVTVAGRTSVAGVEGFELQGNLGMSRVAWKGGSLVAEVLNHSRFAPALPLMPASRKASWSGTVHLLNSPFPAEAKIEQAEVQDQLLGRALPGRKSVVRLRVPDLNRTITVESTFLYGIGLVRQVQWSNGTQDIEIRLLQEPGKES